MILELEEVEVTDILRVLGDLPTKSNAWPLMQKIIEQATTQQGEQSE